VVIKRKQKGVNSYTITELWSFYDEQHVQKRTAAPDSIGYSWKNLEPYFGRLGLADIDQSCIEGYVKKRLSGHIGRKSVSATVRKELLILSACFNWHAKPQRGKMRLIEPSELPIFDLPEVSQPRERWLVLDEVQALLNAARAPAGRMSRAERFLWIALETAARKQAILDLTWDRVDLERNVIHYALLNQRKTTKNSTSVPISASLRPILLRMREEAENAYVLDHTGDVWAAIQAVVVRAGLDTNSKSRAPRKAGGAIVRTGISPHTLRHTAATHMARSGVPLWKIAKILGNTTAVVEKVYAKWSPDDPAGTVDKISHGVLEVLMS
jgi:integrase